MAERSDIWFVSDVHLGLRTADPGEREARFIAFLKGIPTESAKAQRRLAWSYSRAEEINRPAKRFVAPGSAQAQECVA